jgi:hypothetical protein
MSPEDRRPERYESARDLPKFREMEQMLKGFKVIGWLKPSLRAQFKQVEADLNALSSTIDRFYEVLGPRHWVFHDHLNVSDVNDLLTASSVDEAEQRFIALQADGLEDQVRRLRFRPGFKERYHLLELAMEDYAAGRYAGMVHLVLSVMDGFVNDFTAKEGRKGLHARSGAEMEAWDAVVSHAQGLARVHEEVFQRGFYKLVTDEVFELYRNGIVHGTVVHFNNEVVATKAWNYLFAVEDWAVATEAAAKEPEPEPGWGELLGRIRNNAEQQKRIDQWNPRTLHPGDDGFEDETAVSASRRFLELWQRRNWGEMSAMVLHMGRDKPLAVPREVKEEYADLTLDSFEIREMRSEAAAVTMVEVDLTVNGEPHTGTLRWIYEDEQGSPQVEPAPGEWHLVWWGPHALMDRPAT